MRISDWSSDVCSSDLSGNAGSASDHMDNERRARRGGSQDPFEERTNADKATQPIAVYNLYVRIDKDGDGFAELRHVVGIGDGPAEIVSDEYAEIGRASCRERVCQDV